MRDLFVFVFLLVLLALFGVTVMLPGKSVHEAERRAGAAAAASASSSATACTASQTVAGRAACVRSLQLSQAQPHSAVFQVEPSALYYQLENVCITRFEENLAGLLFYPAAAADAASERLLEDKFLVLQNELGPLHLPIRVSTALEEPRVFFEDIPALLTPVTRLGGLSLFHSLIPSVVLQHRLNLTTAPFFNVLLPMQAQGSSRLSPQFDAFASMFSAWTSLGVGEGMRCFKRAYVGLPVLRFDTDDSAITDQEIQLFRRDAIGAFARDAHECPPPDVLADGEKTYRCRATIAKRHGARRIVNDVDVLDAFAAAGFLVNFADFSADPAANVRIAAETDVLVGVHADDLLWSFMMSPRSIVLEVAPLGLPTNDGRNTNPFSKYGGVARRAGLVFYSTGVRDRQFARGSFNDFTRSGVVLSLDVLREMLPQIYKDCIAKCGKQ